MAQVKIYGIDHHLAEVRTVLSEAIHMAVMEALAYPEEKRFHRFFPMNSQDFIYPSDRSERYIIVEISMFEGRSAVTKRKLIRLLFERIAQHAYIEPNDVEITIYETPKHHWGIRGLPGDELTLGYKVDV
ncbi:phenylpyruvate tautomerase PptA (4-oxalocrotonate tautomerase family) [Paenibacillus shirakamiensis]|uniref:Phenylpyruvate tautomerase PptA (4-oxalocrotonate tautomerase family) n=1 Tax=Paenibacillus shirakamiensis TaxID=1265935 RepID=A0ABS4JG38_9BACL|nr:tautomerase family protein [Paenibacillus shirakamiensis]MBP2000679.1 phenylpyruvate tautomerase PptA (4-oxalocrotonate tautomerase family) [Paenibacillus shirakamiensis]